MGISKVEYLDLNIVDGSDRFDRVITFIVLILRRYTLLRANSLARMVV